MSLSLLLLVVASGQPFSSILSDVPPTTAQTSDPLFAKLDQDQNGKLTRDEVSESQQPFFQRALRVADLNKDGMLSASEFSRAVSDPKPIELPGTNRTSRVAAMDLKSLDKDADGRLTIDEIPLAFRDRFQQLLDRVGTQSIDVDKVQAYLRGDAPNADVTKKTEDGKKPASASRPGADNKSTPGKDTLSQSSNSAGRRISKAVFDQMDRNSDGKLTKDEVPRRIQQKMKAADRNNDGSISSSEFNAAMEQIRQK